MATIPSTGRKSKFQARQAGYKSVEEFARSLPLKARVADVGAGFSRLGNEVTQIRSDVIWYNIDPCYTDHDKKVDGVLYLSANLLDQTPDLKKLNGTFDMVYSYWFLPHLSLENDSLAEQTVKAMSKLLKKNGLLIVGPVKKFRIGLFSPLHYKGTSQYKASKLNKRVVRSIVLQTKLWWLPRKVQLLSNRYDIHLAKFFVGGKITRSIKQ